MDRDRVRAMEASFASYILHLDLAGAFRHAGPWKKANMRDFMPVEFVRRNGAPS
jgi:hypothetical protein